MKFWPLHPYYERSDWKTWLSERFSEVLTSKLWNKKNTYCQSLPKWSEIELYSLPYGFIKILWQIHTGDSHVEFTGKNKVGNTTWPKLWCLIGQRWQNSFQKLTRKISLSVSGEQASKGPTCSFPFSEF